MKVFLISFFFIYFSSFIQAKPVEDSLLSFQNAFISIAEKLKPSVVHITIERTGDYGYGLDPTRPHPPWQRRPRREKNEGNIWDQLKDGFNRLFGNEKKEKKKPSKKKEKEKRKKDEKKPEKKKPEEPEEKDEKNKSKPKSWVPKYKPPMEGAGSGVVFDNKGHILTNNHVVNAADKIWVTFADGRKFEARIIGVDKKADLAVVKIPRVKGLKPCTFSDSAKIKVGQWAIAFGSPLGLEHSLSVGVVSALGRHGFHLTDYENFIQTDAAVNPGNSGGPLLDIHGNVIGLNTMILNAPGSGLSFAIPSNTAKRVAEQLITYGKVQRPYLGIRMQELDLKLIKYFNARTTNGALIADIYENGPAHQGGLKSGDIIIRLNNKKIRNTKEVEYFILSKSIGDVITVKFLRKGNEYNLKITLKQQPEDGEKQTVVADLADNPEDSVKSFQTYEQRANRILKKYGYQLGKIDRAAKKQYGILIEEGLYVKKVDRKSRVHLEKNLNQGDVIYKLNHKKISSFKEFYDLVNAGLPNALVEIKREDTTLFIVLDF
ncbi:trypsin-like peptidase domain-containing protein [Candidatus Riflebacteria bacterium]